MGELFAGKKQLYVHLKLTSCISAGKLLRPLGLVFETKGGGSSKIRG